MTWLQTLPVTRDVAEARGVPAWQRRVAEVAGGGMAACVGLMLVVAVGFAALVHWQYSAVDRLVGREEVLAQARVAVGAQRLAERELRHGGNQAGAGRAAYNDATASAAASLRAVRGANIALERAGADDSVSLGARYTQSVAHVLAAMEAGGGGNAAAVDAIDKVEVEPNHARLATALAGTAARLATDVAEARRDLSRATMAAVIGVPMALLVGCGGLAFFWSTSRSCVRREAATLASQAAASFASERRFRALVQFSPDLVLLCDAVGGISSQNLAAETIWQYGAGALVDRSLLHLVHRDDQVSVQQFWDQLCRPEAGAMRAAAGRIEARVLDGTGAWRDAELTGRNLLGDPAVGALVLAVRDIAERKARERQLARRSLFDELTSLPNPVLLEDRLDQALGRARRSRERVAVILLRCVQAADHGGVERALGDEALLEVVARLRTCVRAADTVAIAGGALAGGSLAGSGMLAVVLEGLQDESDLLAPSDRIAHRFAAPFEHLPGAGLLAWSGGMVLGDPAADRADGLLVKAGLAVERAARDGARRCVLFDARMGTGALDRVELESDLRSADLGEEMRLHFQPIVALGTGAIQGFEALVRWQHPVRGLVAPRDFLAVAEGIGLMAPLGRWVLASGCNQMAAWHREVRGARGLKLNVNLSGGQFRSKSLADEVAAALRDSGLPAGCLVLEISEFDLMQDPVAAIATLWELKGLGVELAIDNFGVGSVSLPYLRQLPLDVVKIDASLVRGVGRGAAGEDAEGAAAGLAEAADVAKLRACVTLAHSLGMQACGQGIETGAQAALLASWRCVSGQGYHLGKPTESDEAGALLQRALAVRPAATVAA